MNKPLSVSMKELSDSLVETLNSFGSEMNMTIANIVVQKFAADVQKATLETESKELNEYKKSLESDKKEGA